MTTESIPRRAAFLFLVLTVGLLWPAATAAAPAAPRDGPTPSNICFIPSLYRDLLGRAPDAAEVDTGLSFLMNNARDVYASTLLTSDEYRTLLVQGWFQKFLGRPASDVDISFWLGLFGSGAKDENIIADIISSAEYFNEPRVGMDNGNFVRAVFQDLLGRLASDPEVASWVTFIMNNSRGAFVSAILGSTEYQKVIIQAWYQRFLDRAPTGTEVSQAQGILSSGTDEDVIANLVSSGEYFARAGLCSSYLPLVTS